MQAHSTNAAVKIPAYIEALEITLALRWKICIDQSFLFQPAGSTGSIRNESRRLAAIFFETGNYSSSEAFSKSAFESCPKNFLNSLLHAFLVGHFGNLEAAENHLRNPRCAASDEAA